MKTHTFRAAGLAGLACAALAACSGDGPVAPDGQKTANLGCQMNRVHADCGPVINPPGDTTGSGGTTTPAASYKYYPFAYFYKNAQGIKTAEVGAESDSYANVAYTLADVYITLANCYTGADVQTVHKIKSGYGSPFYAAAGVVDVYPDNNTLILWKINGTHQFYPATGATGGGTFSTSYTACY